MSQPHTPQRTGARTTTSLNRPIDHEQTRRAVLCGDDPLENAIDREDEQLARLDRLADYAPSRWAA